MPLLKNMLENKLDDGNIERKMQGIAKKVGKPTYLT
jgi:hypothetical protein